MADRDKEEFTQGPLTEEGPAHRLRGRAFGGQGESAVSWHPPFPSPGAGWTPSCWAGGSAGQDASLAAWKQLPGPDFSRCRTTPEPGIWATTSKWGLTPASRPQPLPAPAPSRPLPESSPNREEGTGGTKVLRAALSLGSWETGPHSDHRST